MNKIYEEKISEVANAIMSHFDKYKDEYMLYSEFMVNNTDDETFELVSKYGLRNSQLTCIAPFK